MLSKKIKRLLITVLSVVIIGLSLIGGISIHNRFTPSKQQIEYKVDMTEYKIKQVINTNKLQTLEIEFIASVEDTEYDKSKFKWLDNISKAITTRKLIVTGSYKALFTYDMSKCSINKNNDGNYTITINSSDVEVNIVSIGEAKVNETESAIGRYYSSTDSARVLSQLNTMAKEKVNTQENVNKTMINAKNNLIKLFQTVGIDINKVYIDIN